MSEGKRDFVRIPAFMEFGFDALRREVIEKGRCTRCGTCAAFCDKIVIEKTPNFQNSYDTTCGLCYTVCPRTFIQKEEIERRIFNRERAKEEEHAIGVFRKCYAVRRSDSLDHIGQDGGAVTALLAYAIENQIIDCAVVTSTAEAKTKTAEATEAEGKSDESSGKSEEAIEKWRVSAVVARDYETLKMSAGTKYTIFPSVVGVKSAIESGCERIAFVGLPCQIQGLRKVQTTEQPYDIQQSKLKLLIGLFCMENFNEEMLEIVDKICPLENVRKFDIKGREMLIYDRNDNIYRIPLSEIEKFVGEGCLSCDDFASELADISVGSVGSPEGFSTVIVRSEIGERIVEDAYRKGFIEAEPLSEDGLKEVVRLANLKRKKRG